MSAPSPVVASWELALRLKQQRERLKIEVKAITDALGFSRNYWSAVENERRILSPEALIRVLDLFKFDKKERAELLALRIAAKERGWWSNYSDLFDADIQRLFGLEQGAQGVRGYESLLIPGLLQTSAYIRAIMLPAVTLPQVEVDERVEARLRRQARLEDPDDPFTLTAIISEAALRQQIGGREVLKQQLVHLADLIESHPRKLDVRVIPFTATACGLFGAATVHLIDFESPRLPTLAWQESVTAWGVIDDEVQVRDIAKTYQDAYEGALSQDESLHLVRAHIREL